MQILGQSNKAKPDCEKPIPEGPAEMFPPESFAMAEACFIETCGALNKKETPKGLKEEDKNYFAKKYRDQLKLAKQQLKKDEEIWLKQQLAELNMNRPFGDLKTEEKILATIVFLNDIETSLLNELNIGELLTLSELRIQTAGIQNQYSASQQENLKFLSKKSTEQIEKELGQAKTFLHENYSKERFWPYLDDVIIIAESDLRTEKAAKSDYYRKNLLEQTAYVKTLGEALKEKEKWKKDLVDLGTIRKDFPSLEGIYLRNSKNTEGHIDAGLLDCALKAALKRRELPSQIELNELKSSVQTIKAEIGEQGLNRFSTHSKGLLNQLLRNTEINLPPSKESHEAAFAVYIQSIANRKTANDSSARRVIEIYNFGFAVPLEDSISRDCQYGILKKNTDHAVPAFDQINLTETISDPQLTKGVVAHEYFHILDPGLNLMKLSSHSSKTIHSVKACLSEFHGKRNYYLSEDWADAGAAVLTARSKTNMSCSLFAQRTNLQGFTSGNDEHSPALFRVLHEQIYKEQGLGPQCSKFVKKYVPKLKKCL